MKSLVEEENEIFFIHGEMNRILRELNFVSENEMTLQGMETI